MNLLFFSPSNISLSLRILIAESAKLLTKSFSAEKEEANTLFIPVISSKLVKTKIPKDCLTYVAKNDNIKSYKLAISEHNINMY